MINELWKLQALPCLVSCLSPGTRRLGKANGVWRKKEVSITSSGNLDFLPVLNVLG